jgi:hypothetical protein
VGRRVTAVKVIDASRDPRWDRFVERHPDATVYHLAAWSEIMSYAFRFKPEYLAAEGGDGELRGVMPLVARTTPVRGSILVSLPWLRAGGPLAADAETEAELLNAACVRADGQGRTLTLDSAYGELDRDVPGLACVPRVPTWIADLPEGPEAVPDWLGERSKNIRRGVKRARDHGVTVRLSESEGDLRTFFGMYLRTMRKHRSLPRPWRQLTSARRLLGPRIFRLFVAERDGSSIAGGVFHTFGETMDLLYNASDDRALDHRPNHALYSEVVAWAAANGMKKLDFGGAPVDSSLANFKAQWGGVEAARYCYEHDPRKAQGEPGSDETRMLSNPSELVDRLWGKAPLPLTRLAGAISFRYL